MGNSIESEATQSISQQLEPTSHQLAVTTTALLLTLLSATISSKPTEPQMPPCLTSLESIPPSFSACAKNSLVRSSRSAIPLNPNRLGLASISQSYQKSTTAPRTLTSGGSYSTTYLQAPFQPLAHEGVRR